MKHLTNWKSYNESKQTDGFFKKGDKFVIKKTEETKEKGLNIPAELAGKVITFSHISDGHWYFENEQPSKRKYTFFTYNPYPDVISKLK